MVSNAPTIDSVFLDFLRTVDEPAQPQDWLLKSSGFLLVVALHVTCKPCLLAFAHSQANEVYSQSDMIGLQLEDLKL